MAIRVLKAHVEAAIGAINGGPYKTKEEAAQAIAQAVIEVDDNTRWVVLVDLGIGKVPMAYGPYAKAETARKAILSGLMLPAVRGYMLLAMRAVPRRGHPEEPQKEEEGFIR